MGEYVTIYWGISEPPTGEKCVICDFSLNKVFPKDFPDEFKFCCQCKAIAFEMVSNELPLDLWIRRRADKLKKIITVFGRG